MEADRNINLHSSENTEPPVADAVPEAGNLDTHETSRPGSPDIYADEEALQENENANNTQVSGCFHFHLVRIPACKEINFSLLAMS